MNLNGRSINRPLSPYHLSCGYWLLRTSIHMPGRASFVVGRQRRPSSFMLRHGGSWVTQTGGQPYQTLNTERKDGKVGPSGRSAAR